MKNTTLNIMKGLCMLLVVAGHANCPFKSFIYLFHVPTFFMISGYLFKNEYYYNYQNLFLLFRKRLSTLWLPYVLTNIFFLCLSNTSLFTTLLYTMVKQFCINVFKIVFFCYEPRLGGASWFLGTLFFVTFLFAVTNYLIKYLCPKYQIIFQAILSITFIFLLSIFQSKNLEIKLVFARILTVYILFFLGYVNKYYGICTNQYRVFLLGFVGLIILFFSNGIEVDIASNKYPNFLLLIILSLAGWYFTYAIALLLEKISIVTYLLEYIGSHTLSILLYHFVVFYIINLLYPNCSWWEKVILGVIIPLSISAIFNSLRYSAIKSQNQ